MIKSYSKLKRLNKEKFKVPKSTQDIIPIDTIYKDGIFRMGNKYSKSYRFLDINYSIASKEEKMNLSLEDIKGKALVISQFTLYGNSIKGNRPSFINAAKPDLAKDLYLKFIEELKSFGIETQEGEFGADMKVELLNDGPVTIIIDTKDANIK